MSLMKKCTDIDLKKELRANENVRLYFPSNVNVNKLTKTINDILIACIRKRYKVCVRYRNSVPSKDSVNGSQILDQKEICSVIVKHHVETEMSGLTKVKLTFSSQNDYVFEFPLETSYIRYINLVHDDGLFALWWHPKDNHNTTYFFEIRRVIEKEETKEEEVVDPLHFFKIQKVKQSKAVANTDD